jgi:Asp-tRNA(Asn)/Glu-tRNA(Gln) amidotransferase A subunit family amidase
MERSLLELVAALRAGTQPLLPYLDELAARFAAHEPQVQAFVPEENRFRRLKQEAQTLLARYVRPEQRPPLFGLPVGVKDIFHVDSFFTRAGSRLPAEVLQGTEATVVSQLKAAGALIVGKTVTTEFAYFAPGPTRNPHHPEHTPGGSSSGSAAAVAAGLCPLALGTQTIGSISRPAAFCGVVGYKPTYERISRQGVIPLAPSLDHVGLLAADVAAVQLAGSVLVENWQPEVDDRRPVLGIPTGPYLAAADEEGRQHFAAVCAQLAATGYQLRYVPAMPDFAAIVARHNLLMAVEAAQVHEAWFAQYGAHYHEKTKALLARGQDIPEAKVAAARAGREILRRELQVLMDQHSIDVWLSPPAPGAAPAGLDSTGDPIMNLPWTHSGLPTMTIPAGKNGQGLPLGLQMAGRWYTDEQLIAWASRCARDLRDNDGFGS